MDSHEIFNFPDGDVVLRATNETESRDFQVHKCFLSYSSPVFKDMFTIPQPSPAVSSGVDVITISDPPRALELVLRFVYPSPRLPAVENFTILSEALIIADKYDIEVARARLRSSFTEFAKTEPLRAYAVACRFGLTDEMKIASSHTTSIHLPDLPELPDEFKHVPATEYHRLLLLHSKYRKEVEAIASRTPLPRQVLVGFSEIFAAVATEDAARRARAREAAKERFEESIREGIPLNHESLVNALKTGNAALNFPDTTIQSHISSIFTQANELNLTV